MANETKTQYYITSVAGKVGPFATKKSAQQEAARIRQSGAVPARMKVEAR